MTNEELLSVAEIVERATNRLHRQAAEHEAKMAEHRASFGARTDADAKLIAGLREERNGLLTQVQDMRAEIARLREDRDQLLANLTQAETESRVARETLQTEIERLKAPPKRSHPVKVGEWLRKTTDGLMYKAGERFRLTSYEIIDGKIWCNLENGASWLMSVCEPCDPPHTEPVPKRAHPVAVGGYLRRLTGFNTTPAGEVARVTLVDDDDPSQLEYEVVRPNGQKGRWSAKGCEPCDPSATHDTPEGRSVAESVIRDDRNTEPKPGDTVRLMRTPTHRDYPATWEGRWGLVGREAVVVNMSSRGASRLVGVTFADGRFLEWPVSCVEVVRTEPDEIKVGDVVEVFQATANCTFKTDIGTRGTVLQLDDSCVYTAPLDGFLAPTGNHVALCDVRTVTT
jgi:outer membrane murein-binding lipoprotein Lpp